MTDLAQIIPVAGAIGTVARGASLAVPWAIFGVQLNRDAGSGDVSATAQTFTYGTAP